MRATWIIPLLLLPVLLASAGTDASLLSRLVSADEETREAAREEWDELDDDERFAIAHAGLSSDDPDLCGEQRGWCMPSWSTAHSFSPDPTDRGSRGLAATLDGHLDGLGYPPGTPAALAQNVARTYPDRH